MSTPTYSGSLTAAPVDVVKGMFLSVLTRPLDTQFVEFTLDGPNSELIIRGLDTSPTGAVGIYSGEYRWRYNKANLTTMFDAPFVLESEYPLTFRQLKAQLLSRYQFQLEENEFALTANGAPLTDDSQINTPLALSYVQARLFATAQSGRFTLNSTIGFVFIQPHKRIQLRTLVDSPKSDQLSVLVGG